MGQRDKEEEEEEEGEEGDSVRERERAKRQETALQSIYSGWEGRDPSGGFGLRVGPRTHSLRVNLTSLVVVGF